jgi:adenosylmethionine-8-amino-7-oxononanoate aminotransferase
LTFAVHHIPYPDTWEDDDQVQAKEDEALDCLQNYLNLYCDQIAALIIEPLIQGASGMRLCRPSFVAKVIAMVRAKGVLVIFDEVMTGFYRTGSCFALEQIQEVPDFLCLAKGISGGFLPLAVTITTQEIYNAFLDDNWKYAFAHGHSYTANPIACAASIASLVILQRGQTIAAIGQINQAHRKGMAYLAQKVPIFCPRIIGTIAAFNVSCISLQLRQSFLDSGLLLRPLGNTIYLMPPYCTSPEQLNQAYEIIARQLMNYF